MSLPSINETASYNLKLPSGKTIKYRPYFVKEQKILLMAQETGKQDELLDAFKKITSNCTFGVVNVEKMPLFELEYLFLNIRCKSVGENVDINLVCKKCGQKEKIKVDLSKVSLPDYSKKPNKFMLTDKIGLMLRYPSIDDYNHLGISQPNNLTTRQILDLVPYCIENIFDEKQVYVADKDFNVTEAESFFSNATEKQITDIVQFFKEIPTLSHLIEYNCKGCNGAKKEFLLEGVMDFFV